MAIIRKKGKGRPALYDETGARVYDPSTKNIRTKSRDGRRLPENEPRAYEISELRQSHQRMIELAFLGYDYKYIANRLNVTSQTVSDVMNSSLATERLEIMTAEREAGTVDIARQIKEIAPEALRLMKTSLIRENARLMMDNNRSIDKIHLDISKDILDRGGWQPPKGNVNMLLHLTPSDLEGIKKAASETVEEVKYEDMTNAI